MLLFLHGVVRAVPSNHMKLEQRPEGGEVASRVAMVGWRGRRF